MTSTAVTVAVELPSIVGLAVLGQVARRTKPASAESDVAANRRATSYLLAVPGFGSVLISLALRYASAATAVVVLVLAVVVVMMVVAPRIRTAGARES